MNHPILLLTNGRILCGAIGCPIKHKDLNDIASKLGMSGTEGHIEECDEQNHCVVIRFPNKLNFKIETVSNQILIVGDYPST